jgi:DNA-binding response OmpR family regulator
MSHEVILVIDDNRQIADFLSESLLPSLGYEVLVARDDIPPETIKQRNGPGFVLLDLQLRD